ncbi:MAG: hypothetical protein RH949_30635 [Coleofasciculus sp. A1-SPW-01]|uniref:hypothetical protein n=1 Tax=Coleofasciculus sp. A1-SPW-01 TaxID=3070819 RepID=UPI0032F237CC
MKVKPVSFICLAFLMLGLSGNCQKESNSQIPEIRQGEMLPKIDSDEELSMQLKYIPNLIISIPWGNQEHSIPHTAYEKVSLSGMFTGQSKRKIRPVYPIRLDQDENLYLIFDSPQGAAPSERKYRLMRFNNQGNLTDEFDINLNADSIERWQILDFHPDHQGGVYLLEVLGTTQHQLFHRLRRVNSQSQEIWSKKEILNYRDLDFYKLAGKLEYLIAPDRDSLYLPTRYPKQGLASFDVNTGDIISANQWNESASKLTITSSHEVYYSRILDDASRKRHVLIRQNLSNGNREVIESEIQYLHDLAGVDAEGKIYPRIHNGIARLSDQGKLEWQQSIYGIVVRSEDQHIFICSRADRVENTVILEVEQYDSSGNKIKKFTFQLPEQQLQVKGDLPRLISVDQKSRFYFYGGETDHQAGTLFVFSSEDQLPKIQSLAETDPEGFPLFNKVNQELLQIESQVGSPNMFEIDSLGHVYIPLSDPQGFKVIRLQP